MQVSAESEGNAVPRATALLKLDEASKKLRKAATLIDEAAGGSAPKGFEKEHEEMRVLAEEARDVFVRVRAARDLLDAGTPSES